MVPLATLDRVKVRETRYERYVFSAARRAEIEYARKLRAVARNVGQYIRALFPGGASANPAALQQLHQAMRGYAEVLRPWATATATRMITDVSRRDLRAWRQHGERISRAVHREVAETPIGNVVRARLAEQIKLITSLPIDAANRVHDLTIEQLTTGKRSGEIAKEIMRSGHVTESRATLIARTETGRTVTELTRARALSIGSTGYIWRSARDRDVRKRHKELEGTFHKWDEPPLASDPGQSPMYYHAGAGPNCRCFAEPVVPDSV